MESQALSPSAYAESIGVQRSSISHILSGRNKPSLEMLQKTLMAFPQLNPEWLVTGNGDMFQLGLFADEEPKDPSKEKEKAKKTKKVPKPEEDPEQKAQYELMRKAFGSIGEEIEDDIPRPSEEKKVIVAEATVHVAEEPKVNPLFADPVLKLPKPEEEVKPIVYESKRSEYFSPEEFTNVENIDKAVETEKKTVFEKVEMPPVQPQSQPLPSDVVLAKALAGGKGKQIQKIVIFYDDGTFGMYTPE